MNERERQAQEFERRRPRMRAVAYRMLGSLSDTDEVESLDAWLTTVVGRVALNMLRARKSRREDSFDLRLPEPIVDRADGTDPEHEALVADSVGLAMLVVLDT